MTEEHSTTQTPPRSPLRRSSTDRVIGGVCGGLARTLGIDPVIVRVITAVLALLGAGFALYIIAWILIPDDEGESAISGERSGRFTQFALILLLALAGLSLLRVGWPGTSGGALGFFLCLLIIVVAWQAFGNDWFLNTTVPKAADGTTTINSQGVTIVKDGSKVEITTVKEPRSILGMLVWNALAVAVGVMLLLNFTGATDLTGRTILAVVLGLVGLGLVISAFAGRARGLIALGLLLGVLMLPTAIHTDASTGERTWIPTTISAATQPFDLGVGDATLDLREVVAGPAVGQSVDVQVHVGAGQLTVLVPRDMNVTIQGRCGLGAVRVLDLPEVSGANAYQNVSFGSNPGSGTVVVNLEVGLGQIEVRYA